MPLSQTLTGRGQGIGIKLAVPAAPAHAVDRPALRRQLDKALSCPVSLVAAPAGAGKTVLLAHGRTLIPNSMWSGWTLVMRTMTPSASANGSLAIWLRSAQRFRRSHSAGLAQQRWGRSGTS